MNIITDMSVKSNIQINIKIPLMKISGIFY
jgi:hypothetical protein